MACSTPAAEPQHLMPAKANPTEKLREISLLACCVDKAARGEGGGIQRTETGARHRQSKNDCADRAEDFLTKRNRNRIGVVENRSRQYKEVCYVGK